MPEPGCCGRQWPGPRSSDECREGASPEGWDGGLVERETEKSAFRKIETIYRNVGTCTRKDALSVTLAALRGLSPRRDTSRRPRATANAVVLSAGKSSQPPADTEGRTQSYVLGALGVPRGAGAYGAGPRRGRSRFSPALSSRNAGTRSDWKAGTLRGALRPRPPRGARPEAAG